MGYIKRIYHLRNGKQVSEHHSRKHHAKGDQRSRKNKVTPEQMRKNNKRMKDRKIQRLLLNNFADDDKYITLTYPKTEHPNLQQVQKDVKNLLSSLKRYYRGSGTEQKWCKNIERTKKGIYHVHMVINAVDGVDIGKVARAYWKKRHSKIVDVQDTYMDGGFEKLAKYLAKTERDEDGTCLCIFSHSRTVKDVEPEVKEYKRRNVRQDGNWKEIQVPKGYELVKESVFDGIDPAGYPVRHYTLIKIQEARRW